MLRDGSKRFQMLVVLLFVRRQCCWASQRRCGVYERSSLSEFAIRRCYRDQREDEDLVPRLRDTGDVSKS
jgi:hypothetical protein